MSLQKRPVFKAGNILTHEMLEILSESAIGVDELKYFNYSDGVLKGCNITTTVGSIKVGKGIAIIRSKPFYINEEMVIPIQSNNKLQVLVLRATEEEASFDFIVREVKLLLVAEEECLPYDVELCRFRLQSGAALRTQYRDFQDMNVEYDTVCYKYAKWAAYNKPSLSLIILNKFMEESLKFKITKEEDKQFLSRIAATDGSTLNAIEINMYLSWKLNQPYMEKNTAEMYKALADVLRQMKGDRVSNLGRGPELRKMIID